MTLIKGNNKITRKISTISNNLKLGNDSAKSLQKSISIEFSQNIQRIIKTTVVYHPNLAKMESIKSFIL